MADLDPNVPLAPGPLTSRTLGVHERLQKCAQVDSAHVQPGEPASDFVAAIQTALRKVDNATIPEGEDYGSGTVKAVVAFKTKNRLFTRGTQTIDPIVGILTIQLLDRLMKAKEPSGGGGGGGGGGQQPPRLALSGQCLVIGELKDNPSAPDMQFADPISSRKSITTAAIVGPIIALSDNSLESLMLGAMAFVIATVGGSLKVRPFGLLMCRRFFSFSGAQQNFAKGSVVSDEAKTDNGFINFVGKISDELNRRIRAAGKAGLIDDRAIAAGIRPLLDVPGFLDNDRKFSGALAAFIGGFQGYHVEMCNLQVDTAAKTFTYGLDVTIFDHFGVDDSDINRGASGGALRFGIGAAMASFFLLQHDRSSFPGNRVLSKYRPFRITMRSDMGPFTRTL